LGIIHENPHLPPNFSPPVLDRLVLDDHYALVMLFIRLRAVLFELCPDHLVARCETCGQTYTPEQLGTGMGNGCYLCRHCGADLRESLIAHARMCPNLTQQPLARLAAVTSPAVTSPRSLRRPHPLSA
jgi:hypothetical protein